MSDPMDRRFFAHIGAIPQPSPAVSGPVVAEKAAGGPPRERRGMTDAETVAHLREHIDEPMGHFGWPTDACGYDQHIRFVKWRNARWPNVITPGQPTWRAFVSPKLGNISVDSVRLETGRSGHAPGRRGGHHPVALETHGLSHGDACPAGAGKGTP